MSYDDQTKDELQDELRSRDLPVSGTKEELVERLEKDDGGLEDQTKDELQDELRARDLPVSGTKDELIERLEEDDEDDDGSGSDDDGADDSDDDEADDGSGSDDGDGSGSDQDPASADDAEPRRRSDEGSASSGGSGGGSAPAKKKPLQLARLAAQQLEQLSGRRVDGTSGLERTEEGWRIGLELVEAARIPPSTDVLGTYEVIVDDDGDLVRYERLRRYIRGQAGEDQA